MNAEELKALQDKVGADAAAAMKKELDQYEVKVKQFASEIVEQKGGVTKTQFDEYKKAAETALNAVTAIAEKQGTTLAEVSAKLGNGEGQATKSISQVLSEDSEDLKKVYNNGSGYKTYMITGIESGHPVMKAVDLSQTQKAAAAAISSTSVTQAMDAATLLRIGVGAQIYSAYRNTSWIFDLCNTINASFNGSSPFVIWFDEQAKVGASALVAEGAAKPLTQYQYKLNSATYKKEATLVGFTEEFQMDFAQLESTILNNARIDVINRVNSAILPNIISAATLYNTELSFRGGVGSQYYIGSLTNDYDAIAAMAAQVDNATFGARANAAVMSTFKKYRMGIIKETTGGYINPPDVLAGISFVGNPAMASDALLVGDLKQYNIILRGGLIVRVGYNGTDFANNMYSVVLEQFYFDYISTIRKVAIVSGPTFQNVKNTLNDDQGSL